MPRLLIRMDDRPDKPKAAIVCTVAEAKRFNDDEHCMGVFATVNAFVGTVRRKEQLERICAWPIDIDDGSKDEQKRKLEASPLVPSLIVETKRGFQAYWFARDAKPEHWNAIVLERLVPHFGADKNARDLCRILRVPGYWHFKDPREPFLIRTAWEHQVVYTERQMGEAFRWVANMDEHRRHLDEAKQAAEREQREKRRAADIAAGLIPTETLWEAIGNLDARETLLRLSGSHWVSGEQYTFRRNQNGNYNLIVDGKTCSVFVDASGKIGSSDRGGPTPAQWLRWFKHPWPTVIEALKSVHPHLQQIDEANRERERAEWRARRAA